jgi:hypothetical protein
VAALVQQHKNQETKRPGFTGTFCFNDASPLTLQLDRVLQTTYGVVTRKLSRQEPKNPTLLSQRVGHPQNQNYPTAVFLGVL